MSQAIYLKQCVHHTVVIIFLTVTIYFSSTKTLWQTPSYQLTNKVLCLIVITRCRTSPFFKVLTLIVITRTPTHFVKTAQVHNYSLLQHEQSSTLITSNSPEKCSYHVRLHSAINFSRKIDFGLFNTFNLHL